MQANDIRFILKSEALSMIKAGKMFNHENDLKLIEEWNENFNIMAEHAILPPSVLG